MADIITLAVIVLLLGLAIRYIYREKKRGIRCIGCPMSADCKKKDKDSCK
jgi:hypothetical protein